MPTPDHLDAVTAAASHHRLLFENDSVRVLDTRIAPGQTVPLHTHCWPAATYIVSWSDIVRRDGAGQVTLDTRVTPVDLRPGVASCLPAQGPHTLENVGMGVVQVISVELKTDA